MAKGYFSAADRHRIADMWADFAPIAAISYILKVDQSTIYREIRRGNVDGNLDKNGRLEYDPGLAQERFQ